MVGGTTGSASFGAVNGARAAYELHHSPSQENSSSVQASTSQGTRSYSGSREPRATVAPYPKDGKGATTTTFASHTRVGELGRPEGSMSRSGSEADSLLDLYKRNAGNSHPDVGDVDPDIPENMYKPEEDDPEGWIHRDKLAKIESEELQAAGITLAKARRGFGSRSGRRVPSRESSSEEPHEPGREDKRARVAAPVTEEDEETEKKQWDLRTPDEIDPESVPVSPVYSNPVLRGKGSKIPILSSSPLPVPQDRIDRDIPLPRKRTMSGSLSPDEGPLVSKGRHRRSSAGSQILLDDGDMASHTPTPAGGRVASKTSSPVKSKTDGPAASPPPGATATRKVTAAVRKPSAAAAAAAKIVTPPASTASPGQRPRTRSGEADRPRAAVNRPEGDPPWLATMYKPDPRLPPDQQIIPTHARRQQQAQWNDGGSIPNIYDRAFAPLAVVTDQPPSSQRLAKSPAPPHSPDQMEDSNAWPLKPMASIRSSGSNGRPGTSDSKTGGYSTMPKVASPPLSSPSRQSPRVSGANGNGNLSSPAPRSPRMQEFNRADNEAQREKPDRQDGGKAKGCGCCVVM